MNEIEDFVEDPNENSDLFDCEFTSVDAVVNQVTVFTGWENRATENGERTLVAYGEGYNRSAFFTDSKKLKDVFCNPNRRIHSVPLSRWYLMAICTAFVYSRQKVR